jgi:hypothetical protein
MTAPEIIFQLVQRFSEQVSYYRSGRYNETELRRDYLDPFFVALGWDVSNWEKGTAVCLLPIFLVKAHKGRGRGKPYGFVTGWGD